MAVFLNELMPQTKSEKKRLSYLSNIRDEFNKMTKEELVEKTIIAYDELNKTLRKLRENKEAFERAIKSITRLSKSYSDLKCVLWGFGYLECGECGRWREGKK